MDKGTADLVAYLQARTRAVKRGDEDTVELCLMFKRILHDHTQGDIDDDLRYHVLLDFTIAALSSRIPDHSLLRFLAALKD